MNADQIELPAGADLVALVKKAYELSQPQGLGFLHFQPGGLTDDEAKSLIRAEHRYHPVSLDYVRGRAVKFTVFKNDAGRLLVDTRWYDHTRAEYRELLATVGVQLP